MTPDPTDLDELEVVARVATEDIYGPSLDTFFATFDPPTVLELIERLRKSEAALQAVREVCDKYAGDGTSADYATREVRQALDTTGDTP